jgi:hypothetical protein
MACESKNKEVAKSDIPFKNYRNDSLHFSIDIPENWDLRFNKKNKSSVGFFEPLSDSSDAFQENLVIWVEELPVGISDSLYAKAARAQIQLANPSLKVEHQGWYPSKSYRFDHFYFDFTNTDSSTYQIDGYTLLFQKRGYNLSFASEKKYAADHQQIYNQLLESFKPLP